MNQLITWLKNRPWILPIVTNLAVYWSLFLTYFTQDEWWVFGRHLLWQERPITFCATIQRPLTCVVNRLEWEWFGLHSEAYAAFSLVLIIGICLLLYRLLLRWSVQPWPAAIAASLFPTLAAGSQAIAWFGAAPASLPSYLFGLLALHFLMNDLDSQAEDQTNNRKTTSRRSWQWQLLTILATALALYFKEEALWLLVMLPLTYCFYQQAKDRKLSLTGLIRHLGLSLVFICLFVVTERLRQIDTAGYQAIISTTNPTNYQVDLVKTFFLLPTTHLIQILIPAEYLKSWVSYWHGDVKTISLTLSLLFIGLTAWINQQRPLKQRLLGWWLLGWSLGGFISYTVLGKNPAFLEGRYYFPSEAGMAGLLVLLLWPSKITAPSWTNFWSEKYRTQQVMVGLLVLVFGLNFVAQYQRFTGAVALEQEQRHILQSIKRTVPSLPQKAIIFTEVEGKGFNGAPDAILPFYVGPGHILMILYQNQTEDYRPFIDRYRFWDWLEQGYLEINGVGFGYLRDYNQLKGAVDQYKLPAESIFAFRYQNKELIDETAYIRDRLMNDRTDLRPVSKNGWSATSSENNGAAPGLSIEKAIDNDPGTLWASYLVKDKFIEVDLGRPVEKVTSIVIRAGGVNDQPRKYRFEYSSDGKQWQTGFSDIGRPEEQFMRLVFAPKTIQKFRIVQEETVATSYNWTIADIAVFQSP